MSGTEQPATGQSENHTYLSNSLLASSPNGIGSEINPAWTLQLAAQRHPQRLSLLARDHEGAVSKWTLAEANRDSQLLATWLSQQGIGLGKRVMILAQNSPWHMLAFTACAHLGATIIPASWRLTAAEVQVLLAQTSPTLLLLDHSTRELAPLLQTDAQILSLNELSMAVDQLAKDPNLSVPEMVCHSLTAASPDPTAILFTSGTSGRPKAVPLSMAQLWWGWQNFRASFEYCSADVGLAVAPFSHIGGFNGTTNDLFANGGTLLIHARFDPEMLLSDLAQYRVNIMFAVPTMYAAMVAHSTWKNTDLTAFRAPLIGGSAPSPALLAKLREKGLKPINVYGMTETAGAGICAPSELSEAIPHTVGFPFPWVETKIEDNVSDQPGTEEGMLLLRGPGVITHYLDPEDTAESFVDGFLRTGDLVRRTEGEFEIIGRQSETIISGGENIHPTEIENALADFPSVSSLLVVGTPDEIWGEVVTLLFVPTEGRFAPTLGQIHQHLTGRIARFKFPRRLLMVPQICLNRNGKPDRAANVAAYCN
ncbi:hypothetical protein BK816_08895 [Boudabousia tangfeifanii]|uniref:Uncharacterized protein n=1 Tax=Boudabousia tangfeifanii TaxID=1912795 RepID=A0A1D9MM55_9ACTO|nr:AMP-binding protein [Boudabousia tangfeifanii]AOZ73374.1 hypothetical protein BK816_08895 [Boudabousia tangfeifanii]